MAVTAIWSVKGSVGKVLRYAGNAVENAERRMARNVAYAVARYAEG